MLNVVYPCLVVSILSGFDRETVEHFTWKQHNNDIIGRFCSLPHHLITSHIVMKIREASKLVQL